MTHSVSNDRIRPVTRRAVDELSGNESSSEGSTSGANTSAFFGISSTRIDGSAN